MLHSYNKPFDERQRDLRELGAACEELRKKTGDLEAAATQLWEKLHVANAKLCSKLQALEHELGWLTYESEQRQEQHEHKLE